jgi:hypothetical protein
MKKTIYLDDAISAIKSLYNILGVCGTKAAVKMLEELPDAKPPLYNTEKGQNVTQSDNFCKKAFESSKKGQG